MMHVSLECDSCVNKVIPLPFCIKKSLRSWVLFKYKLHHAEHRVLAFLIC